VLVLPFRRTAGGFEVAVLRRADDGSWQGVAGGGTVGESVVQAARREAFEEAGIPPGAPLYRLQTFDTVPAAIFGARAGWPPDTYVVAQHFFACELTGAEVVLSAEHTEVRWVGGDDALRLLRYDSNRTAVVELAERLARDDLGEPCADPAGGRGPGRVGAGRRLRGRPAPGGFRWRVFRRFGTLRCLTHR
jgi:dATP pyrophosphohydrolase